MTSLTGLPAFEWILFGLCALGVVLLVQARTRTLGGSRLFGFLVVPALAGILVCVFVPVAYGHEARRIAESVGDRAPAVAVALVALAAGLAFGDLLLGRFTPLVAAGLRRLRVRRLAGDVALVVGVGLPVAAALVSLPTIDRHLPRDEGIAGSGQAEIRAALTFPGHPMDLAFRSAASAYASLGEGSIVEFDPSAAAEGRLQTREVANGLRYPRGLAVLGDTLYVGELGELPCEADFPSCKGPDLADLDPLDAERLILRTSHARILAFHVNGDGTLGERRTVLDDLPVANSEHGVNDIEAWGGRLYTSLGNVDLLFGDDVAKEIAPARARLLGTVISFATDGSDVQVFARGLRNVYGLAFDDRGQLYGADNDGLTRTSWRREEVVAIEHGANYGYPFDGTFAPYAVPRAQPLWVLDTFGSGGIAWVRKSAAEATLYVGGESGVNAVNLAYDSRGQPGVHDRSDVVRVVDVPGYVTVVKPQGSQLFLGAFTYSADDPNLYVVDVRQP